MELVKARCTNCGGVLKTDKQKENAVCPFLKRGQETAFFREHILFFGVKIKDNSAQTTKNGGIVHAAEKYFHAQ